MEIRNIHSKFHAKIEIPRQRTECSPREICELMGTGDKKILGWGGGVNKVIQIYHLWEQTDEQRDGHTDGQMD